MGYFTFVQPEKRAYLQAQEAELAAQPQAQKHLGVGQIALGVFLGNLMFGLLAAIVYAAASAK